MFTNLSDNILSWAYALAGTRGRNMRHHFDPEKAIESIVYVANRTNGDLYNTMKIFYIADKWHLERYGSLIFGDRYARLPYGPVPSETYDLIKSVRDNNTVKEWRGATRAFEITRNKISSLRDANTDVFSRSDLAALDSAMSEAGHLSFGEMKKLTHDAAYEATAPKAYISLDAIAATLPNGPDVIQHLADPHPGTVNEC